MSDTKKPTVSEIRARPVCLCPHNPPGDREYLLDLVERMGVVIGGFLKTHPHAPECGACKVARALLEEIKQ